MLALEGVVMVCVGDTKFKIQITTDKLTDGGKRRRIGDIKFKVFAVDTGSIATYIKCQIISQNKDDNIFNVVKFGGEDRATPTPQKGRAYKGSQYKKKVT